MRYNQIVQELHNLRRSVDRLEAAAKSVEDQRYETEGQFIESDSREGVYHKVRLQYTCTCESFRYKTGLDERGHCKHIRALLNG